MNGFLLIDKPTGITSFEVVKQLRKLTGEKSIGHAGTLDPLATGLLVIALGEGTKLLEYFVGCDKEYEVVGHFGFVSDTYDADGLISKVSEDFVAEEKVKEVISAKFLGEISQVPPKFSALKVGGRKAYHLARKGEAFELKSRTIKVGRFDVKSFDWPRVAFKVACSTGTYIRSLIHDLGAELGVGAYVEKLRRTRVGEFEVTRACLLDNNIEQFLLSLETVVQGFSSVDLSEIEYKKLKHGQFLNIKIDQSVPVMAFYQKKLVGVLEKTATSFVKFRKQISLP